MTQLSAAWAQEDEKVIVELELLFRDISRDDAVKVFCGLSTVGILQSSHIRIANLIHAALKYCKGEAKLTSSIVNQAYDMLESTTIGRDEDPAEDIFIGRIISQRGNYRVFEGNWESSTFFLNRFVNIVDGMPNTGRYELSKRSIYTLLTISEKIVQRMGIGENTVYGEYKVPKLLNVDIPELSVLASYAKFSENDLEEKGLDSGDLVPFIFDYNVADQLPIPCHISMTNLDMFPVLRLENGEFVLFPQAVSTAIRSYLLSAYARRSQDKELLTKCYLWSYWNMLLSYQLLGSLGPLSMDGFCPIPYNDFFIQESLIQVSPGRPLHLIFLFDSFEGDLSEWAATPPKFFNDSSQINSRIDKVRKFAASVHPIKRGITVVVLMGWGRSTGIDIVWDPLENWDFMIIPISDLCHLSDYPKMQPLDLWRMRNIERRFSSLGGQLFNMNGMLNLYGWLINNAWHIVPHENLPQEDILSGVRFNIPLNSIASIREKSWNAKNRMMFRGVDGVQREMARYSGSSYFQEDEYQPLYACAKSALQGQLLAVYKGSSSSWWCAALKAERKDSVYRIWDSAIHWLERIDTAISDQKFSVPNNIMWQLEIEETDEYVPPEEQFISSNKSSNIIFSKITLCQNSLFQKPDNAAEVAMVTSFLSSLLDKLWGSNSHSILKKVFPTPEAKYCHFFPAKSFNDYIAHLLPKAVVVEKADDAALRLGLGWIGEPNGSYIEIHGASECVRRLNLVVDKVWKELSQLLLKFGRTDLCKKLSLNLEALRKEKTVWERTIGACLALHNDKGNVFEVAGNQVGKFNSASIGCRILIEMASSTCPDTTIEFPDELEISWMIGCSMLLFHLGAWSDAIILGLYPAEMKISSFGEVMLDYDFENEILVPFQKEFNRNQILAEVEKYESLYSDPVNTTPVEEFFPEAYLSAWRNEFCLDANQMREVLDSIDDLVLSQDSALSVMTRSQLVDYLYKDINGLKRGDISGFVDKVTLPVREKWDQNKRELPDKYDPSDWYPWNFRRKLSLISKPLVALDDSDDQKLLINPSSLRKSIWHIFHNGLDGTLDERYFDSSEMKKWIGDRRAELGTAFNGKIANKLKGLGWEAESDVLITKVLNKKTEKNFGDVDVLAWSKRHKLVLAIECKDLFFAKTHKEIGNQINEFQGKVNEKGRRDRLLKHFDRLDTLKSSIFSVEKYVGIEDLEFIYGAVVFSHPNVIERAHQVPTDKIFICAEESLSSPGDLLPQLLPWS